jgi:hypothetical protein
MTFTRGKRIALEVLGPPFLGGLGLTIFSVVVQLWNGISPMYILQETRDYLVVTFIFSYVLGIVPSLAYMGVMETAFARGLDPACVRTVVFSSLLGVAAGLGIVVVLAWGRSTPVEYPVILAADGLLVGWSLGMLIKRLSRGTGSPESVHSTS